MCVCIIQTNMIIDKMSKQVYDKILYMFTIALCFNNVKVSVKVNIEHRPQLANRNNVMLSIIII